MAQTFVARPEVKTSHSMPALRIILLTLFLPVELSFFVFGLRLTVVRLIFLFLTPALLLRWVQKITEGQYCFVMSDLFVFLGALWMFVGVAAVDGIGDALAHSGPVALEWLVAYLSTRLLLSDEASALEFAGLLGLVISAVVFDALLDTVTGRYFTHELFGSLTGYHYIGYNEDNYRFGLLRAAGPLEHPIGFGFTCAIGLLLSVELKFPGRRFCAVACALGVVISISSAPQQSAVMGFALVAYRRIFRSLPRKWFWLSVFPAAMGGSLFVLTPTPFGHLFDLLTINSSTAYYRLYIWNSVGPAILDSPFFAVLEGDYEYHGSVDSLWLALSLTYGMPCGIFAALSMIGCCSLATRAPVAVLSPDGEKLGTILGIIIFLTIFMSFTVDFWGPVWILIGLLLGLRANLGEQGQLRLAQSCSRDFDALATPT